MNIAERATQAPSRRVVNGSECTPAPSDQAMSECHAGWEIDLVHARRP